RTYFWVPRGTPQDWPPRSREHSSVQRGRSFFRLAPRPALPGCRNTRWAAPPAPGSPFPDTMVAAIEVEMALTQAAVLPKINFFANRLAYLENMASMPRNKVILAYSGGLDTSVMVPWIGEKYNLDVIAFTV